MQVLILEIFTRLARQLDDFNNVKRGVGGRGGLGPATRGFNNQ